MFDIPSSAGQRVAVVGAELAYILSMFGRGRTLFASRELLSARGFSTPVRAEEFVNATETLARR